MRDQANSVTTLHNDHLGSVSLATTSTGALANQQEYDPWGKLRLTVAGRTPSGGLPIAQTTRNFTGQQLDSTGLLFSNARYYDPATARFVSAATIVAASAPLTLWPGDAVASNAWGATGGGPATPQELNRYSYALNNPLRYTDPSGHCPWCLVGAGIGALVGAGMAYGAQVYRNYQTGMDLRQAMTTKIDPWLLVTGAIAGAVVGGTFGAAAVEAVPGFTVMAATKFGMAGAVGSAVGSVVGQAASRRPIDWTNVAVAGGVGFATGAVAPVVATTWATAAGIGAVANTAQYVATQQIHGQAIAGDDLLISAGAGVIGGSLGGSAKVPSPRWSSLFGLDDAAGMRASDLVAANLIRSNAMRSFGANWFTNSDVRHILSTLWR